MAAGAIAAGGAVSGAGSILGGLLGASGGLSSGDLIFPTYLAGNDPGLSSAQYDALNLLGFGNINSVAGPYQDLVNKISQTAVEEKTKRRALKSLGLYAQGQAESNPGRLDQVLSRLGLTRNDIDNVLAQDQQFKKQQAEIYSQLGPMQKDAILGRANAAQSAAQLLGSAGQFATGSAPTGITQDLLNRYDRNLADQREKLMLQAQFGGFNPAVGLESLQRLQSDRELNALTQAVQMAQAITQGLAGGNQIAQQAAGLNSGAALQGLGIAAQQSQAANQLMQQSDINKWDSIANGVAGGLGSLGQGITAAGILGGSAPAAQPANAFGNTYLGTPSYAQMAPALSSMR